MGNSVAISDGIPGNPIQTRRLDEDEKGVRLIHTPGCMQEMKRDKAMRKEMK